MWLYHYILSSITYISHGCLYFVSIIDVQSMVFANDKVHYGLQVMFVCFYISQSYYHHFADLPESIALLKCLSCMCCQVCVKLYWFSHLSFIQCTGMCVFSLLNYFVMIVRMCTLSYYHHQTESMNHWPLFRVRTFGKWVYYLGLSYCTNWGTRAGIFELSIHAGHGMCLFNFNFTMLLYINKATCNGNQY